MGEILLLLLLFSSLTLTTYRVCCFVIPFPADTGSWTHGRPDWHKEGYLVRVRSLLGGKRGVVPLNGPFPLRHLRLEG